MMDYRITSSRLRTIEDIKREQRLVNERIERQRCLLSYDREQIEEVLSPDYWMAVLSAKAAGIVENFTGRLASGVRGSALGTGLLSNLIGRLIRGIFRRKQPDREYLFVLEDDFDEPDYNGSDKKRTR